MPVKDAVELPKKAGKFCCRLYPDKCDRDNFSTPTAENMHYLRTHSDRKWNTNKPKKHKARGREHGKQVADEVVRGSKTQNVIDHMVKILQQHPQGLYRAELMDKLNESGIKARSTMLTMIARNPDNGITRPERGLYKLSTESRPVQKAPTNGRKRRKSKPATEPIAKANGLSADEEIVLLRASNQRKSEAIMKLLELTVLLSE